MKSIKIVTFFLDEQQFGIELGYVQEFIEELQYTPLPGEATYIKGMANLRGRIITVCDIKHRILNRVTEESKCMVVIKSNEDLEKVNYDFKPKVTSREPVAFMVDKKGPIFDIESDKISAAPSHGAQVGSKYYDKVVELENQLITILDIGKVIVDREAVETEA